MTMPKEVMDTIASDITKAETALATLKDVLGDMKLAGMDITTKQAQYDDLSKKLRSMKAFYELRKAKG